ncbi:hypothetical protein LG293_16315 (plasmid) [Citricoccus nitrophenolicus]
MSDQPESTPGRLILPAVPDHAPGQEPESSGKPVVVLRRPVAILVAAGVLAAGVLAGALIGSGPVAEAEERNEQLSSQNVNLKDRLEEVKGELSSSEAKVEELEQAPALLAAQAAEREEKAAAEKKAADEKAAAEKKAQEEQAAAEKAEQDKAAAEERAAAEKAERTFPGNGTFVVGDDMKAGTYKSDAAPNSFMENCYWARLSGTSGDFGEIITNNNSQGPTTVTIRSTDVAFETSGCTAWERVD